MLIFDEATSALDAETAEGLVSTMNAMTGYVTTIVVTHALPPTLQSRIVLQLGKAAAMSSDSPRKQDEMGLE